MVINHVTFNENVECHQYSPTHTGLQPNHINDRTESSVGGSRLKYTTEFLKGLRNVSVAQTCPDAVKNGMKEGKEWAGGDPQSFPMSRSTNRSVFSRPFNQQNYPKMRRNYVPYFGNNQNNYGGFNNEEMNVAIEPTGTSRYTAQHRNYQNRNSADNANNFALNSNLMPEFAQLCDQKKHTNDEEEPEWFRAGPTSPNDFIDLHGFEGPNQDNHDNHNRNDQLGCVDGNTSGGPTSGASSNNGSPPAKSTPAKVTFNISKDAQRNRRPDMGRPNNWQNNYDNRQVAGALSELFKNYSCVQNLANLRGLTPIVSVQDVESSLLYEKLKFRQMVAQLQTQNLQNCRNYLHPQPIPTASQVLSEIDKILRTSNDPVYKRPEVRTLTKNIVESVIPPFNIMNLMKHPLTEPQSRETIQAALKIITQAKQNASKLLKMRAPTESELRAHMDAIMQDAIIKKRMENLNNELLKASYQKQQQQQHCGRNVPNQTFHQLFRQNAAGRFENHSQSDLRGQCQSFENGKTLGQEINVNRWFSPTALSNKGLPQIPSASLRADELESKFKQSLKVNEKEVK